ncbi:hypothetical protein DPMN_194017 [Dreissena polymorpha]|uniref:Uncharacterized protein n=1 Tax=Dreissena polymorpha TaxID=45954 RepID=A0A9D3Y1Q5_DREPO|nr:hypothetical protein DPMN_194017 [Dreissena polymorpha]
MDSFKAASILQKTGNTGLIELESAKKKDSLTAESMQATSGFQNKQKTNIVNPHEKQFYETTDVPDTNLVQRGVLF